MSARGRRSPYPTRTPVLWLFLGPPMVRLGSRDPLASVEGSFDAWNLFRAAWWAFFGAWALWELYRYRRYLPRLRAAPAIPLLLAAAWIGTLFVSVPLSPSPLFSAVEAGLMLMLLIATVDLALKLSAGFIGPEELLRRLLGFSLALLGLILILWLTAPGVVSDSVTTWPPGRLRGDTVAGTHFLAVMVVLIAGYFAITRSGYRALAYWTLVPAGLVLLLMSQTRTGYVQLALGAVVLAALWLPRAGVTARRSVFAAGCLVAGLAAVTVVVLDSRGSEPVLDTAWDFLVRDERTLLNASGRDGVIVVLGREALANPLGMGYLAGPRSVLQSPENVAELWYDYGILPGGIGDAHNMYLEVFAGAGVLGIAVFLAMLGTTLLLGLMCWRAPPAMALLALYAVVLVGGLTTSASVLPLNQSSTLMMILLGAVAGVALRRARPRAEN